MVAIVVVVHICYSAIDERNHPETTINSVQINDQVLLLVSYLIVINYRF